MPDLPEALIAGREEIWLTDFYRSWSYDPDMFTPEEIAVYARAYQQPGTVRGSCMDYRAAPQDVAQDQEDADQLIDCPVLTMWGEDFSALSQAYDVLDVWKGIACDVSRWAHCPVRAPLPGGTPRRGQPGTTRLRFRVERLTGARNPERGNSAANVGRGRLRLRPTFVPGHHRSPAGARSVRTDRPQPGHGQTNKPPDGL